MLRSVLPPPLVDLDGDFRDLAVLFLAVLLLAVLLDALAPDFFFLVAVPVRDADFVEARDRLLFVLEDFVDFRLLPVFFPAVERDARFVVFLLFVGIAPSSVALASVIR